MLPEELKACLLISHCIRTVGEVAALNYFMGHERKDGIGREGSTLRKTEYTPVNCIRLYSVDNQAIA